MIYKSKNWKHWVGIIDLRICITSCLPKHGTIYPIHDELLSPPLHMRCRCEIKIMDALEAGTATNNGTDGADWWLLYYGILPYYYLSKAEAKKLGWKNWKGNLYLVAPGRMIGGGIYNNKESKLPKASGRIWYEADINYTFLYRGDERILFSNDGLIFITRNHYLSFIEIV